MMNAFLTRVFPLIFTALILTTPVSADDVWTEDAAAAVKRAADENKDLLLLYTGSDWCPPCIKLEKTILSKEEFEKATGEHFVLVKFDFPNSKEQDAERVQQNQEWAKKYGIEGYPTIYLVDKDLRPFAVAGYQDSSVEDYLAMLEASRQIRVERDEKLKEAATKKGPDRAQLLDEAVENIDQGLVELYYPDIVKEIVKLDNNDKLGLRTKWNEAKDNELRKIIMTDMMMVAKLEKPQRAIEFIDEVLEQINFPPADKLEVLQIKLNLVRQLDDNQRTDRLLDEIINLDGVTEETRERMIVKKIYLMMGSDRQQEALKLLDESLASGEGNLHLHLQLAKGEILYSLNKPKEAIEVYQVAIKSAKNSPDILIDLVSAKADALFDTDQQAEALQTLDNFADNLQNPVDLRSEALLHKSMLMRDMDRMRQARLAENRAIEISESPKQRAEMQKMVERMREKFDIKIQ